jgi:hypothetical protein
MPFTQWLKPVGAKANKPILRTDDQPLDVTEFNLRTDLMKALAFIVERGADLFSPLIDPEGMLLTVRSKRFFLNGEILGEDTRADAITSPCSEEINPR